MQLTNILRDVREDAENGRVYLPAEDLRRFGLRATRVAAPTDGDRSSSICASRPTAHASGSTAGSR